MFGRLFYVLTAVGGGAFFAQFPEFYQQYLQRLNGRLDILRQRRREINEDAAAQGLDVLDYIKQFISSANHSLEGKRMLVSLAQEERATAAMEALQNATPLGQLPAFIRFFDSTLASDTAAIYQPGFPINLQGFIYTGLGALTALFLAALLLRLAGTARRRFFKINERHTSR